MRESGEPLLRGADRFRAVPVEAFPPGSALVAPARDGAFHMRRDAAMLERADFGAPAVLRLYRWSRVTLSLGHRQKLWSVADSEVLARLGIPWVRRPTGGRALLHQPADLTYAFAAPKGTVSGVRDAYERVMLAIREGLAPFVELDPAETDPGRDEAASRLPCLAVATGHELTTGGRKLVAGAQRWRRGAFLQHGSIPWTVDRELTNRAVGLPPHSPMAAVGLARAGRARDASGPPSRRSVAEALTAAFARHFNDLCVLT